MNCGRHGFWPAMRAIADRRRVTNVSPVWLKAPCASFLGQEEIKPHKVRYYLERRDAEFEPKMAGKFWCVYREVQVLKKPLLLGRRNRRSRSRSSPTTRSLESRPSPRRHRICRLRQAAMRRASRGIMSTNAMAMLRAAGRDRSCSPARSTRSSGAPPQPRVHRIPQASLDAAYPASTAIKLILDNHSAHISRGTRAWLDTRPPGRFDFTFTPKHGSWFQPDRGLLL